MPEGIDFLKALEAKARMFAPAAKKAYMGDKDVCDWLMDPLAEWAHEAYGDEIFMTAATGYVEYCMNVAKCQAKYEATSVFNASDFESIVSDVYENQNVMSPYMWAAILIYCFWESMTEHIRMFRNEFLNKLPDEARLIEFACGHGVLGLVALKHLQRATLIGYDIGPSAISIANKLASVSGLDTRSTYSVQNILNLDVSSDKEQYDGVIAMMIAEHLENPEALMKSIQFALKPDGLAFFSTALESAQFDHVYEFNKESELVLMAEKYGMRVKRMACDTNATSKKSKYRPRALAMVLSKV